jgi:hypothetical protein
MQRLFGIIAGCAIAILCLAIGKWLISGIIPFWLAWIAGIGGLVVVASNWRLLGAGFAWSMALALLALIVPIPWPGPWLLHDAERIADGGPYCIQVADDADYRQAGSWLDFSPVRMRPQFEGGRAMQFHAILAVGSGPNPKIYNWSYWSMSWRDATVSRAPAVVSCTPKRSFAAGLPYLFAVPPEQGNTVRLRLAGRSFSIPASYQPRAQAVDNPQLGIILDAPGFTPAGMNCDRGCANRWAIFYFRPAGVMSWLNGPSTDETRIVDESTGPDGPIKTRIDCSPAGDKVWLNCRHYCLHDGVMFYFNMSEVDLGEWRQVQNRLITLFRDLQRSE